MKSFILFSCSYFLIVAGLKVSKIPSTGYPPKAQSKNCLLYDAVNNQLISFGGLDLNKKYLNELYAFNLTDFTWDKILPQSDYKPPGLYGPKGAAYSNYIYVFYGQKFDGISSDVFRFNLESYNWEIVYLQGTTIPGRITFSMTSFIYSNASYVAIFGGITSAGYSNELYL